MSDRLYKTQYRKDVVLAHQTAKTGAVTLIQRFGSALNLNVHFHGAHPLSTLFNMVANDQPVPIEQIREALDSYLELSRKHLQAEDDKLFPIMGKVLGDEEWEVVASRLPERRAPLFTEDPDEAFADLKSRLQ